MSDPKLAVLTFPTLDLVALEAAVKNQQDSLKEMEIVTPAQVWLHQLETERDDWGERRKHFVEEMSRTKNIIAQLQDLYQQMELAERDAAIQLSVILNAINQLRQAGVV